MRKAFRVALAAFLVLALAGATTTPNRGFTNPSPFSDSNVWGTMIQGDINALDQMLGGNCTVPVTSPSTTATTQQLNCLVLKLTGTLSQNTTLLLPTTGGGFWIVDNETAGNFTLTILTTTTGSSGFAPSQGAKTFIYADGAGNIVQPAPAGLAPSGNVGGDLAGNLPNPTVTSTHLTSLLPSNQGGVFPGAIQWDVVSTPEPGWNACDGSAVSRTGNPLLNARLSAVGYPFGTGDGSTTFNLPNVKGRFIAGFDPGNSTGNLTNAQPGGVSASTIGNTGGEQAHTLTIAEMPSHSHALTPITLNDPGHSHTQQGGSGNNDGAGGNGPGTGPSSTSTNTTGITVNQPTIQNTGGGGAHNNVPPAIVLNCVIKLGMLTPDDLRGANDNRDADRLRAIG